MRLLFISSNYLVFASSNLRYLAWDSGSWTMRRAQYRTPLTTLFSSHAPALSFDTVMIQTKRNIQCLRGGTAAIRGHRCNMTRVATRAQRGHAMVAGSEHCLSISSLLVA
jgi:hypothetical protein